MDRIQIIVHQVITQQISEQDGIRQMEYLWRSYESNHNNPPPMGTVVNPLTPEEIMIEEENRQERRQFLVDLMNELSPKYRQIIWLYAVNKLTMQQIADILGISKQAVSTYIKRIRHRANKMKHVSIIYPIDNEANFYYRRK